MLDLLITNANLPDGRTGMSVAVHDGKIAEVAPRIDAQANETLDAGGMLLSPPFVDPHFHMDATLSYGLPRVNASGTLLEGIALWGELKPTLTADAIIERAPRRSSPSSGLTVPVVLRACPHNAHVIASRSADLPWPLRPDRQMR